MLLNLVLEWIRNLSKSTEIFYLQAELRHWEVSCPSPLKSSSMSISWQEQSDQHDLGCWKDAVCKFMQVHIYIYSIIYIYIYIYIIICICICICINYIYYPNGKRFYIYIYKWHEINIECHQTCIRDCLNPSSAHGAACSMLCCPNLRTEIHCMNPGQQSSSHVL